MSITYSLIPNHLTDAPNDYMAVVEGQRTRNIDDVIDAIVDRGSTVTRADILSVMEGYQAVVNTFLDDGDRVQTPIFRTSTSIKGVFVDQTDTFDRSRHYIRLNITPGERIGSIAEGLTVEKVAATQTRPVLELYKDFSTDTLNETITPGSSGELRGSHLKVDPEDTEQGIFFIAADGTETKATMMMRNMPANLIFMIPDGLASGEYNIEVRAIPKNHNNMRTGRLDGVLIVP
jgi:hypothetical protein